jgi:undecaprenyl-diphosphatase
VTTHASGRILRYWWLIAVLAVAAYGAIWAYFFTLTRFGALAPLALVVVALPVAIAIVAWLWRAVGDRITAGLLQVVRALWSRVEASSWYRASEKRHSTLWRVVIDRVDPHLATGLGLSVLIVAAGGALWAFGALLVQIVSPSSMTTVDHRVVNLFQMIRTPGADRVMLDATYIGSGRAVGALSAAVVITALALRRRRDALIVVASLGAGAAFFSVVKLIVRRPRPPLYDARIVQSGFSFPSGHATMAAVFYATVAVILVTALRSNWLRTLVIVVGSAMVVWIGLSRIYLGVHYPSDVLAGWAAGLLWALLVLVAERVWSASRARRANGAAVPAAVTTHPTVDVPRRVAAVVVPVAAIAFLVVTRPAVPAPPQVSRASVGAVAQSQLVDAVRTRAPLYTVSLFGHRQEPLNLVFVGTLDDLQHVFRAAGWVEAEHLSVSSLRRAAIATIGGGADASGPVTPSFLGEEPESLAFNQPVGHTFARRHHIRIWLAPFGCRCTVGSSTPGATPVWLATASFDDGYAIAAHSLLPVHQIAPDIDDERDYIVRNLGATGLLADTTRIQLVPPETGTNAFGEPFFTHGQAVMARLR